MDLIRMIWRYGVVVAAATLVLGVLNALPQFLGGEPLAVVRYASVEDAEARLGVALYRPAALPRPWHWPPSRVRAAIGRPDWIEFDFGNEMILCQTTADSPDAATVAAALVPGGTLLEDGSLVVAGRTLRMQRVLLDEGTIVHELWWREANRRVMLRGQMAADSLPALARTIVGTR